MPRKIKGQQSRIKRCTAEEATAPIAALAQEVTTIHEVAEPPYMGDDGEYHCRHCGAPINVAGQWQGAL